MQQISLFKDFSLSAIIAGFITVLVGFTSSAVFVIQAAQSFGATAAEISSWFWALGLGIGLTGLVLSLYYKMPIATAWSTPGAAVLIAGAAGISLQQAIGAFIISGILMSVAGFSGVFARASKYIPTTLASAMLAGLLLQFGINLFSSIKINALLVLCMLIIYLLSRRFFSRYAVLITLVVGACISLSQGQLQLNNIPFSLTIPIFIMPEWSLAAIIGLSLPLFVVTMASQNLPGIAIMKAASYQPPVSAVTGWTGLVTAVLAPFGAFAINFAAISAAICLSEEAHPDHKRRYVAAVSAGIFYIILGLFGASVTAIFAAFPHALIATIAGLALFGTISAGLVAAFKDDHQREPALITFLLTASGVSFFGLGAAFWGLLAGIISSLLLNGLKK